jgi:hypothetical protein
MAAAIKALNAKIRSNKYLDYFCSTRTLSFPFEQNIFIILRNAFWDCSD